MFTVSSTVLIAQQLFARYSSLYLLARYFTNIILVRRRLAILLLLAVICCRSGKAGRLGDSDSLHAGGTAIITVVLDPGKTLAAASKSREAG